MIIIKIQGGLGNQMFQYAYGRSLSLEKKESLYLDTSHYARAGTRAFELGLFNIQAKMLPRLLSPLFRLSKKIHEGYWQSEKYFTAHADIIRADLTQKEALPEEARKIALMMSESNSVSVHIRRGDYLSPKHQSVFAACEPAYYESAIAYMQEKAPNARFFVFSDDMEWARTLPFPKDTIFVDRLPGTLAHHEMALMSECKHHVIANSSFSWWGAWLGKNPTKIVVAPKKYYVDPTIDTSDWTPKTWIRL